MKEIFQRLKIKTVTGQPAALRANTLRQVSTAVARAMRDAEKRGLRPAFDKGVVILATDPANSTPHVNVARINAPLMRPVSFWSSVPQEGDTFREGDYEITFIPYDDGYAGTWEGIVYRTGSDLPEDTRYSDINIETEEPYVIHELYYPEGGGDPRPVDPRLEYNNAMQPGPFRRTTPKAWAACSVPAGEKQAAAQLVAAGMTVSAKPTGRNMMCSAPMRACMRVPGECCSPPPDLRPWLRCSAAGCAGVATACLLSGPGWPKCFGPWCVGAMVTCLFAS